MTRAGLVLAVLAGALAAATAHAQYKLSELMAQGAKIMTAKEVGSELRGAKVSGVNEFGASFEIELKDDGKAEGVVFTPRGPSGMVGSWTVNHKNQLCTELTFTATGVASSRCVWYWKAGSDYYSTNSQTDAEAANALVDCMISGGTECKRDFVLGKRTVTR